MKNLAYIKLTSQIKQKSDRTEQVSKSIENYINKDKYTKSSGLTKLYLVALSTVAGLSIAGQVLIQWIIVQQSNDAKIIKKASNQRTLSQQLSKAALVIDFTTDPILENESLAELETVTEELKSFHFKLQENNNSENVTELFAEIKKNYQALIHSAEGLIELIEKERSGELISPSLKRVLVQEIVQKEDEFSAGMNRIALQYSKEAQEKVEELKKIELILLIVTLKVLILEGLFIFRPAANQIVSTVKELLAAQKELENSKARYLAIIEDQTELICRFLPDRTISFVNNAFCDYFKIEKAKAIGENLKTLDPLHNFSLLSKNLHRLTKELPAISVEQSIFMDGSSTRFVQWRNCGIFDSQGKLIEVQSVGRDITESKQAEYLTREKIRLETEVSERQKSEAALKIAEEKYRNIFENAIEGIFQISTSGELLSANPALAKIYGYPSPDRAIAANFNPNNRDLYVNFDDYIRLKQDLKEQETIYNFEIEIYRLDRTPIWISINIRSLRDKNGKIFRYEGSAIDITENKKAREQLIKSALYDNLTNLPNRTLFMERLNKKVRADREDCNCLFAVLFVDLDRFKAVNDNLGHEVGDRLLIEISRRLESVVRISDTVCRWGGDEFVILLNSIETKNDATKIGDRILEKLTQTLTIGQHQLFPSGSVGIALSSSGYNDAEDLLRNADTAMYRAKARGKCRYHLFE
ncbi:MAG: diguanylate cyclase domain-containing protein [Prochloraceae cyanobacterium]